ncbi:MAG: DUF2164 domain-containing protein [Gemmatimonadota bacterium]|jgi:uncharacterized protein (DUF2164 family)|nr:DUF2164 domain-containing protein [Gemmatimonadota bacterium]
MPAPDSPLRIHLSEDRRRLLIKEIMAWFQDEYDESLSEFRAQGVLDFFIAALGPAVYNQGVQDARGYLQDKLADLEGEVYEPERR